MGEVSQKGESMKKPAVFLDRDGTLNHDPGYLSSPDQMNLLPGVPEGLLRLRRAGFELVVVTNQSGVARGLIQEKDIPLIHRRLNELIEARSGNEACISHYEYCPKLPEDPHSRRKPKPDLILDSAQALQIDVSKSWMIGDRVSDLEAGRTAGCRGVILVRTGEGQKAAEKIEHPGKVSSTVPDLICDSLIEAAQFIVEKTQGF